MGLDMYLYKKHYVKNWDHNPKEDQFTISVKKGGKKFGEINPKRIAFIVEEVGYWRKFNALHGWIVQNVADGTDDCKEIYISDSRLEQMLDILKKVKSVIDNSEKRVEEHEDYFTKEKFDYVIYECSDELEELFPPTEGFFFGGDEIDTYYKNDVEKTITLFEELLEENSGDLYYRASW